MTHSLHGKTLYIVLLLACSMTAVESWITPSSTLLPRMLTESVRRATSVNTRLYEGGKEDDSNNSGGGGGAFGFLSPYESKIPDELRDEIFAAEANTPAAQARGQRVALYALVAITGVLAAFFNGFLSELRAPGPDGAPGTDLVEAGFGWVVDNFLFSFFFLNKIGGGLLLILGTGSGLLAEAELDTKRINAEKIYEELVRRREAKAKKQSRKDRKKKNVTTATGKKKRRSGKEAKRLGALSEVVAGSTSGDLLISEADELMQNKEESTLESDSPTTNEDESKKGGIMGSLKGLYEKADTMAASQALLLNKQLEDAGVVDKITDETGLKVIGKEEAAKLQNKTEEGSAKE